MRKFILLLLTLAAVSCTQKELAECRRVKLSFDAPSVKVGLNSERTALVWSEGDKISIYNDRDNQIATATYSKEGEVYVSVPSDATRLRATYPETEGSFDNPGFTFVRKQIQDKAGELKGEYFPLQAEAAIHDGSADLVFDPVGAAFAVNVYNPYSDNETLLKISVRPGQLSESVEVDLVTPWVLLEGKPASGRTYPGQVFACLERGLYSGIEFEVTTSRAVYTIKSNSTPVDLETNDFMAVNVDLKNMKITVPIKADIEDFVDITNVGGSFVEIVEQGLELQLTKDTIPDFSTVGYRWGEKDFPDYNNVIQLPAPSGDDDTESIQAAIDNAPEHSVIQFGKGRYIVDGLIIVDKSYIILRGAGNRETEIFARGTVPLDDVDPTASSVFYKPIRHLINVGVSVAGNRTATYSASVANIKVTNLDGRLIENHPDAWYVKGTCLNSGSTRLIGSGSSIKEDAFCGSVFVTVTDPSSFNVGDKVVVYRPGTQNWIHDLKMDNIIKALNDVGTITQWSPSSYGIYWERVIKAVKGDRIYFDAPLVMSITKNYGGGSIFHCSQNRIKECGIENLNLVSDYNPDRNSTTYGIGDIYHADNAISFYAAEHCWVRNVHTHFFSSSAVAMTSDSKNITVQECAQWEPAAYKRGGLRYAFHVNSGQYCLIKDCSSDEDRHQFVTAGKVPGPNVFLRCTGTNALSNIGPHQRWATGTLYDHVSTTQEVSAVDAGNSGTGQGWQGVNQVFWCCTGKKFCMQNPWVTGKNYAIGCTFIGGAQATLTEYNPYPNPGYAPDGSVVYDREVNGARINSICRPLEAGEPVSLYEYQLAKRLASGNLVSNLVGE